MSKKIDSYIISRLERAESKLKWAEQSRENILEELRKAQDKLVVLANMFEKTTDDEKKYTWYKVKGNFLISSDKEAYKIIDEILEPIEEMPF